MNFIDLNGDSRVKHGDAVEIPVYELNKNNGQYSSYVSKTGMFIHLGDVKGVLCPNAEFIAINGPTIGLKTKTKVSVRKAGLNTLASTDCAILGVDGKYDTVVGGLRDVETKMVRERLTDRAIHNRLDSSFVNVTVGRTGFVIPNNNVMIKFATDGDFTHHGIDFAAINVPGMKTLKKYHSVAGELNLKEQIANDIIQSGAMTYSDFQNVNPLDAFHIYGDQPTRLVGDLDKVKAIPLRLSSANTFRSKKEIFNLFDSTADMRMQKTASRETISIKKDRESGKYDLAIDYKDPSKKIFKGMNRSLYGLEPEKLKGVLSYLGYDDLSADSIQNRVERVAKTSHTLPANHRAKEINVGDVESKARNRAKKIVNSAIQTGVPTALMASGVYGLVRDINERNTSKKKRKNVKILNDTLLGNYRDFKLASELSSDMSGQFEKVAMDCSSPFALKVAKTMNISSRYFDKIAAVEEGKIYNLKDISRDIVNSKDEFNKIACRLVDLHETQLNNGENTIDSRMIKEAIEHIDLMLKSANEVVR